MCHLTQNVPLFTNEKRGCAPDSDTTMGHQAAGAKAPSEHPDLHLGVPGWDWPGLRAAAGLRWPLWHRSH